MTESVAAPTHRSSYDDATTYQHLMRDLVENKQAGEGVICKESPSHYGIRDLPKPFDLDTLLSPVGEAIQPNDDGHWPHKTST